MALAWRNPSIFLVFQYRLFGVWLYLLIHVRRKLLQSLFWQSLFQNTWKFLHVLVFVTDQLVEKSYFKVLFQPRLLGWDHIPESLPLFDIHFISLCVLKLLFDVVYLFVSIFQIYFKVFPLAAPFSFDFVLLLRKIVLVRCAEIFLRVRLFDWLRVVLAWRYIGLICCYGVMSFEFLRTDVQGIHQLLGLRDQFGDLKYFLRLFNLREDPNFLTLVFSHVVGLFVLTFLVLRWMLRVFRKFIIVVNDLLVVDIKFHWIVVLRQLIKSLLLIVEPLMHIRKQICYVFISLRDILSLEWHKSRHPIEWLLRHRVVREKVEVWEHPRHLSLLRLKTYRLVLSGIVIVEI